MTSASRDVVTESCTDRIALFHYVMNTLVCAALSVSCALGPWAMRNYALLFIVQHCSFTAPRTSRICVHAV